MRIGYAVEGTTDRAFVVGLGRRWCPDAELVEGRFRGTSGLSRRREIPQICVELSAKEADVIVFLSDSNDDRPNAWRDGIRDEEIRVPEEYRHRVLVGMCQRNIECWLCWDPVWIAAETGRNAAEFRVADPKGIFEASVGGILSGTRHETIVELVQRAPLHRWLGNPSFEEFYERVRLKGKQLGCSVDNLRERRG